jgi:hypothetical protein
MAEELCAWGDASYACKMLNNQMKKNSLAVVLCIEKHDPTFAGKIFDEMAKTYNCKYNQICIYQEIINGKCVSLTDIQGSTRSREVFLAHMLIERLHPEFLSQLPEQMNNNKCWQLYQQIKSAKSPVEAAQILWPDGDSAPCEETSNFLLSIHQDIAAKIVLALPNRNYLNRLYANHYHTCYAYILLGMDPSEAAVRLKELDNMKMKQLFDTVSNRYYQDEFYQIIGRISCDAARELFDMYGGGMLKFADKFAAALRVHNPETAKTLFPENANDFNLLYEKYCDSLGPLWYVLKMEPDEACDFLKQHISNKRFHTFLEQAIKCGNKAHVIKATQILSMILADESVSVLDIDASDFFDWIEEPDIRHLTFAENASNALLARYICCTRDTSAKKYILESLPQERKTVIETLIAAQTGTQN